MVFPGIPGIFGASIRSSFCLICLQYKQLQSKQAAVIHLSENVWKETDPKVWGKLHSGDRQLQIDSNQTALIRIWLIEFFAFFPL